MSTRLIIARHGNTFGSGDIITRVGGRTDLPLVESGMQQGRKIGVYLRANHLLPDIVFAAELKRTIQTAEQALSAAHIERKIESLSQFNEIDYGPDENKPEIEVIARLGEQALKDWDEQALVPDGWNVNVEALIDNWLRFGATVIEKYKDKAILVVTSNGIARFAPYLTGNFAAFRQKYKIKMSTGALCLLHNENGKDWNIDRWNVKP